MNARQRASSHRHMQRVVGVLVVVICVVLAIGRVEADPSAAQWKAAEQTLRTQLAAQQVTPLDVTRKVGALGTAFWVREQVGARTVGKLVVVRGSTIFATRSEATLRALLTKDEVLRTRTLTARDLLYLVEQLAALPAGLGNVVTEHKDRTLLPTLRFGKTAKDPATLVLHSFRQTTTPGSPAHPTQPLMRATLTIAPDYALAWNLESIDRPAK